MKLRFLIFLITSFISVFVCCQKKQEHNFTIIGNLSNQLKEISGIVTIPNDSNIYAINDSGNENKIYKLNSDRKIISTINIPGSSNIDWEDLAYNQKGTIYIGDFGNNSNDRNDLAIYKVSNINTTTFQVGKIPFVLEDQKKFPPKKKNKNFDIEAFVYMDNYFYLFTKNRSSKFNGKTKVYKLIDQPGKQTAKLIDIITTCNDANDCFITGAAINNNQDKIALLTYNKIYLLENFRDKGFSDCKITKYKLNHFSQKEGITFKNNTTLYIVDEKRNKKHGKLYEYQIE